VTLVYSHRMLRATFVRNNVLKRISRNVISPKSSIRCFAVDNSKPEVIATISYDKNEQPRAQSNSSQQENPQNEEVPPKRPPYVLGILGAGLILFGGYYFYENRKAKQHAEENRRLTHDTPKTTTKSAIYVPHPHVHIEKKEVEPTADLNVVTSTAPNEQSQQREAEKELEEEVNVYKKSDVAAKESNLEVSQPEPVRDVTQQDSSQQPTKSTTESTVFTDTSAEQVTEPLSDEEKVFIDINSRETKNLSELEQLRQRKEIEEREEEERKQHERNEQRLRVEEEERINNERLDREKREREERQNQENDKIKLLEEKPKRERDEHQEEYIESLKSRVERLERELNDREDELRRSREYTRERESELLEETDKQIQQAKEKLLQYENELIEKTKAMLAEAKDEYERALELERLNNVRLTERLLTEKEHKLTLKFNEQALDRIERLAGMTFKVYSVEYAFNSNARYLSDSLNLQTLSLALFSLQNALRTNGPFKPEIDVLKQISSDDELVIAAVNSIPEALTKNGVPLLEDLQDRFVNSVKHRAVVASYAPQNAGLLGYIFSRVASPFIIEEKGLVDGDHANARLARAEFYLKKRKLAECVDELEQLSKQGGDVAFILRDWIREAKARLVADLALEAIEAHVINLTSSINQ
jgi:hypothetical protein